MKVFNGKSIANNLEECRNPNVCNNPPSPHRQKWFTKLFIRIQRKWNCNISVSLIVVIVSLFEVHAFSKHFFSHTSKSHFFTYAFEMHLKIILKCFHLDNKPLLQMQRSGSISRIISLKLK